MTDMNQNIIKQAISNFKKENFQKAKEYYQQAADKYGVRLFANSIQLCELRMSQLVADTSLAVAAARPKGQPVCPSDGLTEDTATQQLEATQKLLEHYYARCQELEYQLMESR